MQRQNSAAPLSLPVRENDNVLIQPMNAFAFHLLVQLETKAMGKLKSASCKRAIFRDTNSNELPCRLLVLVNLVSIVIDRWRQAGMIVTRGKGTKVFHALLAQSLARIGVDGLSHISFWATTLNEHGAVKI
jgi:hypothetical protein